MLASWKSWVYPTRRWSRSLLERKTSSVGQVEKPTRGPERSSQLAARADSFGQPKIVPNSKGKRRRPGAKTLQQILKADDELFVDFIAKCLIWDPEKRLKPMAAMKHPWITGVRRMPVSNAPPASAIHSRLSSITSTPSSRRSGGESSKPRISEPSPLTARKTNSGLPASSSGTFTSQSSRIARPSQFSSSRSIAQVSPKSSSLMISRLELEADSGPVTDCWTIT